jgi:hypothetical protein
VGRQRQALSKLELIRKVAWEFITGNQFQKPWFVEDLGKTEQKRTYKMETVWGRLKIRHTKR